VRGTRDRLRERWERSSAVLRAPRVRIAMSGEEEARAAFRSFTARHPRFKVTGAKRWGVALVPLPATFDEYLAGPSKEYLRRQRRRAEKAGYRYAVVTPGDRLPEILAINRSAPSRQGRAMATSYVDPTRVAETFAARPSLHGILDAQGTLRAYADVSRFGDVIVFSRILGHADDLEHGPMYLLVSEVIRSWVERRGANASPAWRCMTRSGEPRAASPISRSGVASAHIPSSGSGPTTRRHRPGPAVRRWTGAAPGRPAQLMADPGPRPRLRVGMAVYGDLTFDSRVRREAATLARAGYEVRLVCLADEGDRRDLPDGVTVLVRRPTRSSVLPRSPNPFRVPGARRARAVLDRVGWLIGYVTNLRSWGRMVVIAAGAVDAWHVHDLPALVAVLPRIAGRMPVVYDSHEIFLETGTALRLPRPGRAMLRWYERRLVARTFAVVTVNQALAEVLGKRYAPTRLAVVHNCPDRWSRPVPRPDLIRQRLSLPRGTPVVLYHGALGPHRGVEQLIAALDEPGLDDAHLVLMGSGPSRESYVAEAARPSRRGRIHVLDPVPPAALLPWVASADVGAMPIEASTLNHYLSTPNKLFECLAAGTPVVVSDFPSMRAIVVDDPEGPLGSTCDPARVDHVAVAVRSVLDLDAAAWQALSSRCVRAAGARWSWERESATLLGLYDDLATPRR